MHGKAHIHLRVIQKSVNSGAPPAMAIEPMNSNSEGPPITELGHTVQSRLLDENQASLALPRGTVANTYDHSRPNNPSTPVQHRILSVRRVRLFAGSQSQVSNSPVAKLDFKMSQAAAGHQTNPSNLRHKCEARIPPMTLYTKYVPLSSPRNIDQMISDANVLHARANRNFVLASFNCVRQRKPQLGTSTSAEAINSSPFSLGSLRPPPPASLLATTQLDTGRLAKAQCLHEASPRSACKRQETDANKTHAIDSSLAMENAGENNEFLPQEWKTLATAPPQCVHLQLQSARSSTVADSFCTYSPSTQDARQLRTGQAGSGLFPPQPQPVPEVHEKQTNWPEDISAPDSPRAGDAASHYSFYRASVEAHIDELQRVRQTGDSKSLPRQAGSKSKLPPPASSMDPTDRGSASTTTSSTLLQPAKPTRPVDIDVSIHRGPVALPQQQRDSQQTQASAPIPHLTPIFNGLDPATARLQRLLQRVRQLGTKLPRQVGSPLKHHLSIAARCLKVAKSAPATPASIAEVEECIDAVFLAVIAAEKFMHNRAAAGDRSSASSVVSSSGDTSLSAELNASQPFSEFGHQSGSLHPQISCCMPTVREADIETPSNRRQHTSPSLSPPRPSSKPSSELQATSYVSFNAPSPSFTAGGVSATWEVGAGDEVQLADPALGKWLKRTASARSKSAASETSAATSDSSAAGSMTSGGRRRHRASRTDSGFTQRHRGGYVYSHENKTMKRTRTKHEIMKRTNLAKVTQDVFLSPKVNIKTGKKPAFTF